jgi:hypothetical protein
LLAASAAADHHGNVQRDEEQTKQQWLVRQDVGSPTSSPKGAALTELSGSWQFVLGALVLTLGPSIALHLRSIGSQCGCGRSNHSGGGRLGRGEDRADAGQNPEERSPDRPGPSPSRAMTSHP